MLPPPLHAQATDMGEQSAASEAPADAPLDDDGESEAAARVVTQLPLRELEKLLARPLRELHIESRIDKIVALAISEGETAGKEGSKKAPSEDECQGPFLFLIHYVLALVDMSCTPRTSTKQNPYCYFGFLLIFNHLFTVAMSKLVTARLSHFGKHGDGSHGDTAGIVVDVLTLVFLTRHLKQSEAAAVRTAAAADVELKVVETTADSGEETKAKKKERVLRNVVKKIVHFQDHLIRDKIRDIELVDRFSLKHIEEAAAAKERKVKMASSSSENAAAQTIIAALSALDGELRAKIKAAM